MLLRPARLRDFYEIKKLYRRPPKDIYLIIIIFFSRLPFIKIAYTYVCEINKKIIGFVSIYKKIIKKNWYIFGLIVSKKYRRKGVGSLLVKQAIKNKKMSF